MSKTQNDVLNLKAEKARIKEKTKNFEKDMLEAKNDFFRAVVYAGMIDVMGTEIKHLDDLLNVLSTVDDEESKQLTQDLFKERTSLISLSDSIKVEFENILPNALAIQRAMRNSHQLKEDKLKETDNF